MSIPFVKTWYKCMILADADEEDMSPLGVALYQYTASTQQSSSQFGAISLLSYFQPIYKRDSLDAPFSQELSKPLVAECCVIIKKELIFKSLTPAVR